MVVQYAALTSSGANDKVSTSVSLSKSQSIDSKSDYYLDDFYESNFDLLPYFIQHLNFLGEQMIQLDSVTKFYGERLIFRDVSFRVFDGEKVGSFGKNGAGKSTLVKIMIGAEPFDAGTISGLRAEDIGFVEQTPKFSAATLLDEMLTVEGVEKFQARKILFGLGFTEAELEKNPNHFSGGESAKISLAKSLLNEPRILILDEPTNHLDIYAIDFLEDFLKNYRGTVIAVTHDRHFLQNCVDKI
ncbi:MAG: ABC-F family ATP-binding cassette domain-containing protein, partial [Selenomonadaceae bacterium]|nr:ABC-F family ATP-binding cassette domain-containing protein [Selenomonadaceae bacterium]